MARATAAAAVSLPGIDPSLILLSSTADAASKRARIELVNSHAVPPSHAAHVGRVERHLPHLVEPPDPLLVADRRAGLAQHAGQVDERRLDHVRLVEAGVEHLRRKDLVQHRPHLGTRAAVDPRERPQRPRRARVGAEVAPQLRAEEPRVGRVVDRDVDDVERREPPRPAQDALDPAVVPLGVVAEALGVVVEGEPGQRPRRLAHVALGVAVVDAQREELEQLAGEVLVRRPLLRVREAQEQLHRAVPGDRPREVAEAPERPAPQGPVLDQHQPRVADVAVRGGEVVVPVEGHALDQRVARAHGPVEPPQHVVPVGVDGVEGASLDARGPPAQRRAAGAQELGHRPLEAHPRHPVDVPRPAAEAGPPQQALDPRPLARAPGRARGPARARPARPRPHHQRGRHAPLGVVRDRADERVAAARQPDAQPADAVRLDDAGLRRAAPRGPTTRRSCSSSPMLRSCRRSGPAGTEARLRAKRYSRESASTRAGGGGGGAGWAARTSTGGSDATGAPPVADQPVV